MYEKLFSPMKIGTVEIKNRLVMSPMGTNIAGLDGAPTDDMIRYYEERAIGGVGLIYTEVCRVNDVHGAAMLRQLSLTKDRNIVPMSKLTSTVHKYGTKIFCQLHHPGRETVTLLTGGQPVVSASDVACKYLKQPTRALTLDEVKSLIGQFIDAAVRAQKAGFDGVELHAAHGYLLGQFFSPYTNKRTDEYGGSFENRVRIAVEIVQGIHERCGSDFPVTIRISAEEFLENVGVTEDYIHAKDGVAIAMAMEKAGVAAVNVSCGIYETGVTVIEPVTYPQGWRSGFIKAVKDNVSIPVIAVNAIREPAVAEKLLEDGVQDFIAMGRSWLADPNWGVKAMEGRECDIKKCIGCLNCFQSLNDNMPVGMPPDCAVNPRVCKEARYPTPKYDDQHRKVAIIGSGPAGLQAAQTCAERGMKVTLYEKADRLGGLVNYASASPLKGNMRWVIEWYENHLAGMGVDIKLGTEATVDVLKALDPDAIIVATGAKPIFPESIPGVHGKNIFGIYDVLGGTSGLENKTVVVAGAGVTGLECANYLNARGCKTTIVDMADKVAPNDNHTIVGDDMMRLTKAGTKVMLCHALKEIKDGAVVLTDTVKNEEVTLDCDAIVLSLGLAPENGMVEELKANFKNVYPVGGVTDVGGKIPGATNSGFKVAYHLFEEPVPEFVLTPDRFKDYGKVSLMAEQEGIYIAFFSDPAVIRKLLPPQLDLFSMPVVTLSVAHVNDPSFADDYYETILGVFAEYMGMPGLYPISMLLGGTGAETAAALGRDNGSMPKKIGAEFYMKKDGDVVTVKVSRKGSNIIDAKLTLGEYNSPYTDLIYQAPRAGKNTSGGCFFVHFDRLPDEDGEAHFCNGALLTNFVEYTYKYWTPAFCELKLNSTPDDPWGTLPINTIIGGALSKNDLLVQKLNYVQPLELDELMPLVLNSWYDRTAFMETGRF